MIKRLLFVSIIGLLIVACTDEGLRFFIKFDNVGGLKDGAVVKYENQPIGAVQEIDYTSEGTFLVEVQIEEPFTGLVKSNSIIYVSSSEQSTDKFVQVLPGEEGDNSAVVANQIIRGSNPFVGFAKQLQGQLSDTLQSLTSSLQRSIQSWKEGTVDEQLDQMESELSLLIQEFDDLGHVAKEKLEKEIIPELNRHMESLQKQLESLNREQEIDEIQKKMDELNRLREA